MKLVKIVAPALGLVLFSVLLPRSVFGGESLSSLPRPQDFAAAASSILRFPLSWQLFIEGEFSYARIREVKQGMGEFLNDVMGPTRENQVAAFLTQMNIGTRIGDICTGFDLPVEDCFATLLSAPKRRKWKEPKTLGRVLQLRNKILRRLSDEEFFEVFSSFFAQKVIPKILRISIDHTLKEPKKLRSVKALATSKKVSVEYYYGLNRQRFFSQDFDLSDFELEWLNARTELGQIAGIDLTTNVPGRMETLGLGLELRPAYQRMEKLFRMVSRAKIPLRVTMYPEVSSQNIFYQAMGASLSHWREPINLVFVVGDEIGSDWVSQVKRWPQSKDHSVVVEVNLAWPAVQGSLPDQEWAGILGRYYREGLGVQASYDGIGVLGQTLAWTSGVVQDLAQVIEMPFTSLPVEFRVDCGMSVDSQQ